VTEEVLLDPGVLKGDHVLLLGVDVEVVSALACEEGVLSVQKLKAIHN
jgi:hypothetical protein